MRPITELQLGVNRTLNISRLGSVIGRVRLRPVATLKSANLMSRNSENPNASEEQRSHQRVSSRITATLLFDGGAWHCTICDISPKGAGIEPAIPSALGHVVELQSARFGRPLLGRVVNVAENRTNIAFELDSAMEYELAKFLATNIDLS